MRKISLIHHNHWLPFILPITLQLIKVRGIHFGHILFKLETAVLRFHSIVILYTLAPKKWHLSISGQWIRAGIHNIRPAGQMWPGEAFNLARKAWNFMHSSCLFDKWVKNISILALWYARNLFLARHEIWVVHPLSSEHSK